jgi:signal transduction histidine kinase
LSTISLVLELLQAQDGVQQDRSYVHASLKRSVEHIGRLVEDLADFNRIRLHKLSLNVSAIDLRAVVRHAVEDCLTLADRGSHRIILADEDAPVMIMGDETRLAQVFTNLIHNATKFTQPNGEIRISVAREPTQTTVVVSDNGIGIEASMLERVFHAFEQASGAEKRGGLGVGLTLARRIVELHGGTISASSDGPSAGSTFTVRLPLTSDAGVGVAEASDGTIG